MCIMIAFVIEMRKAKYRRLWMIAAGTTFFRIIWILFRVIFSIFPMQIQKFVIWAYYAVLSTIGMNWDKNTRIITYFERGYNVKVFGFILCIGIIVYFLGKII